MVICIAVLLLLAYIFPWHIELEVDTAAYYGRYRKLSIWGVFEKFWSIKKSKAWDDKSLWLLGLELLKFYEIPSKLRICMNPWIPAWKLWNFSNKAGSPPLITSNDPLYKFRSVWKRSWSLWWNRGLSPSGHKGISRDLKISPRLENCQEMPEMMTLNVRTIFFTIFIFVDLFSELPAHWYYNHRWLHIS